VGGRYDKRPATEELIPQWPENCVQEANLLHCRNGGLRGTLAIAGVGRIYSPRL